ADLRQTVEGLGLNVSWTMAASAAEFRETQAIERQLQADPVLRNKWFRQQLAYEARLASEEESGNGDGTPTEVLAGISSAASQSEGSALTAVAD
ncbi:hypothetical protein AB4Z34_35910, partial [Ensifer sp. 2YAB10]|uniref:hypothetical protein n=1 Tax=Ensifer sp. 2YAB10 TaxID=3233021 RepID=UPI003F920FF9